MTAVGSPRGGASDEVLPSAVLEDVARAVGTRASVVGRLSGGLNAGAVHVRLDGQADAVLKAVRATRPDQLGETARAARIVEHVRGRGYPTPAWLGVGATATHVWHLTELVDAAPAQPLTPDVVEQLMEIDDLQAGLASEPYDHWTYALRVATGHEPSTAGLAAYSPDVGELVRRLPHVPADARPRSGVADLVHADLNPSNVLVRDGAVVALVDVENAGSGTRATDLVTLQWHTVQDSLTDVRDRLWTKIIGLVGWEAAAVLTTTQVLLQLEWPIRLGLPDVVVDVVARGHRTLDELESLR